MPWPTNSRLQTIEAIEVYLERRKTRQLVGRLTLNEKKSFEFCYEDSYLESNNIISLGPELPLTKKYHQSKQLFPSLQDRLPDPENPAYPDYCQAMEIAIDEKNILILLATIGRRGPSCFVFEPVLKKSVSPSELKEFRKKLGFSLRDFASAFDIDFSFLYKIESGELVGHDILRRVWIYQHFPEVAYDEIRYYANGLHQEKKRFALTYLNTLYKRTSV